MPRKNKKSGKSRRNAQRCGPKGAVPVLGGLFISGEHFAQDYDRLHCAGITSIVACGCQAHHPDKFRYMEIRLRDCATANVSRHLHPAADFIAQSLQQHDDDYDHTRGAVLVHCKAGICRSATMIAAYLLKYRRDLAPSVEDALVVIRTARPCANPRPEFIESLRHFLNDILWKEEHLHDQNTTREE